MLLGSWLVRRLSWVSKEGQKLRQNPEVGTAGYVLGQQWVTVLRSEVLVFLWSNTDDPQI